MDKNTKEQMDNLFAWYENNRFENDGIYSRNKNLIFGFAEFIESERGRDLIRETFGEDREDEILGLYNKGINQWLENPWVI